MKKLMMLVLVFTMVVGLGAFAYADTACDLSEEEQAQVLSVKSLFLGEKVADGTLTQAEADDMYDALVNQTQGNTLRGLGFGSWLRDSEYAEELNEIMPHKNEGLGQKTTGNRRGGHGRGNGN